MVLELISRAAAEDKYVADALYDQLRARSATVMAAVERVGEDNEFKKQKWFSVLEAMRLAGVARAVGRYRRPETSTPRPRRGSLEATSA